MFEWEWATVAAWIETDGYITLTNRSKTPRVVFTQRDPSPLRWIQERIGGSLHQRKDGCWLLVLSPCVAREVIRQAMPYFISDVKIRRAELCLRMDRMKRRNRLEAMDEWRALRV
jgi:hypothetical protein